MQKLVMKMWQKIDIVFKLKSPLHIGYIPFKGSVFSPTRYYVLGRNLCGAITKRITELLYNSPNKEKYKDVSIQVIENFIFSYFYVYDGRMIYFPHYTKKGLKYGDISEKNNKITKSEFEHRFIGSRISTAMDFISLTTKNKSLHEIEFINNKFKDEKGNIRDVKIAGSIWVKNDAKIENKEVKTDERGIFINNFDIIQELILGGESKYGFGHVLLDSVNQVKFPIELKENDNEVKIEQDKPLFAHLNYDKSIKFEGDVELLSGRGYFDPQDKERASENPGVIISEPEYYFAPGSVINGIIYAVLQWDGSLKLRPIKFN